MNAIDRLKVNKRKGRNSSPQELADAIIELRRELRGLIFAALICKENKTGEKPDSMAG